MSFAWFIDASTLRLLLENTSSAFGHINQLIFVLHSVQEFTLLISNNKALKSEVFSHISWPERMLWWISSAECCPLLEVQGTVFLTTSLEYQTVREEIRNRSVCQNDKGIPLWNLPYLRAGAISSRNYGSAQGGAANVIHGFSTGFT